MTLSPFRSSPLILAAFATFALDGATASENDDLQARILELYESSARLRHSGQADSLLLWIDSLESEAVAQKDTTSILNLRTHRGRELERMSRYAEAEAELGRALDFAEGTGDSSLVLEPLYRKVTAIDGQGRPARVVPMLAQTLEPFATVAADFAAVEIRRIPAQDDGEPVAVDAEKTQAVYRDGVLLVRVPKAPELQPRKIRVSMEES